MNIYLAIPIDRHSDAMEMYDRIATSLGAAWPDHIPLVIYKPGLAFTTTFLNLSEEAMQYLININACALNTADAMIVAYRDGVETWGVPQEVLQAQHEDVPVYVLTESEWSTLPIYLRACILPHRLHFSILDLVHALTGEMERPIHAPS